MIDQIRELGVKVRNSFAVGEFQKRHDDGRIQVKTHDNRIVEKEEAFPYGFYAKAKSGRAFVFCQGGNLDGFEIFPVQPGDGVTPPELEEGDAALYTGEGSKIVLREAGDVEILGASQKDITIETGETKMILHGTGSIELTGSTVSLLQGGQPAARMNDIVMSTPADDAIFWNWVAAISSIVATLSGGGVTPPAALAGKITAGSAKVTVG